MTCPWLSSAQIKDSYFDIWVEQTWTCEIDTYITRNLCNLWIIWYYFIWSFCATIPKSIPLNRPAIKSPNQCKHQHGIGLAKNNTCKYTFVIDIENSFFEIPMTFLGIVKIYITNLIFFPKVHLLCFSFSSVLY